VKDKNLTSFCGLIKKGNKRIDKGTLYIKETKKGGKG
jgi:hypothetical protein